MIKGENQHVNVVIRGLIIEEGQLLVTEWISKSYSFLIGGRVDFGESIMQTLHREMMEEIGTAVTVHKLAYFSETIFTINNGLEIHEYGYYFHVTPDKIICPNGPIPNPDSEGLIIRRAPITAEGLHNLYPDFLQDYLPQDVVNEFANCPRFLYSPSNEAETVEAKELAAAFR